MPAAFASKKIPLFNGSPTKHSTPPRKPIPKWVDVNDEDERIGGKRRRQNGNGMLKHPPQAQSTPPPRKKARLSGPLTPVQEQRRLLPIARGGWQA
jgi:hypothetical protein